MKSVAVIDRVLAAVDACADEIVDFTAELIRIPTVNPPGEGYADCARLIGARLAGGGFEVDYVAAEGRPEHTAAHPRVNVVGWKRGRLARPAVHLNGHVDVVPAGAGWTVDPFGGVVRDGRIYGRGACDMKAGIAAAVYAAEAIRRAGVDLPGSIEVSGTVDEESGGFAGVALLAETRRVSADRLDYVIIPEPLNVDRVCIGHRGVYWFEVETRGRIGHGSMPFLGVNAIEHMGVVLDRMRRDLLPALASRTTSVPVVPPGARQATLNINGIAGGQPVEGIQTPCVADTCRAVFDRRFLLEEGFDATRAEIEALLTRAAADTPSFDYALRDLMVVHPVLTPGDSPLIGSIERHVERVLGRPATRVASPGTYDHKHVDRIGGIRHCVAYGPGILDLAHQPDEWCGVDDLVNATKVLALTVLELTGGLS
ncbi:MAG: acetylornithine deacetylase/succinyl-diaminopimelate desuccinylase family protein [Acidobacteriota bacterium]